MARGQNGSTMSTSPFPTYPLYKNMFLRERKTFVLGRLSIQCTAEIPLVLRPLTLLSRVSLMNLRLDNLKGLYCSSAWVNSIRSGIYVHRGHLQVIIIFCNVVE